MLHGGHIVIHDPEFYERWTCPDNVEPLSSHLGMAGPPVRQSLHGRTAQGTWSGGAGLARGAWGPATGWT